jgi:hypothetical protein
MPARSTVSNRNQMRQAREVLKALPPKQREELRYRGIGPGDSYIGMWRMVNAYRFKLNALCKAQARDNVTPIEERQLERDIRSTASRSPSSTPSCSSMRSQSWRR